MDNKVEGTGYTVGGLCLGYQGIKHGLPRLLGIRTEYHTTTKENAKRIKQSGNILNPKFGGTGFSAAVKNDIFIKNSKNYVHITGFNKDTYPFYRAFIKKNNVICENIIKSGLRKLNVFMYRLVGQTGKQFFNIKEFFNPKQLSEYLFNCKTKKFYIPGTDSYFNKNFIPDPDCLGALKSSNPLKVYTNRFASTVAGLKKFGLTGIKENKLRAGAGLALVLTSLIGAGKLISIGLKNLNRKTNQKT